MLFVCLIWHHVTCTYVYMYIYIQVEPCRNILRCVTSKGELILRSQGPQYIYINMYKCTVCNRVAYRQKCKLYLVVSAQAKVVCHWKRYEQLLLLQVRGRTAFNTITVQSMWMITTSHRVDL